LPRRGGVQAGQVLFLWPAQGLLYPPAAGGSRVREIEEFGPGLRGCATRRSGMLRPNHSRERNSFSRTSPLRPPRSSSVHRVPAHRVPDPSSAAPPARHDDVLAGRGSRQTSPTYPLGFRRLDPVPLPTRRRGQGDPDGRGRDPRIARVDPGDPEGLPGREQLGVLQLKILHPHGRHSGRHGRYIGHGEASFGGLPATELALHDQKASCTPAGAAG